MLQYESERRGFAQMLINADKVVMALNSKRWKSEEERAVLLQYVTLSSASTHLSDPRAGSSANSPVTEVALGFTTSRQRS
jgi:hypothetical protein